MHARVILLVSFTQLAVLVGLAPGCGDGEPGDDVVDGSAVDGSTPIATSADGGLGADGAINTVPDGQVVDGQAPPFDANLSAMGCVRARTYVNVYDVVGGAQAGGIVLGTIREGTVVDRFDTGMPWLSVGYGALFGFAAASGFEEVPCGTASVEPAPRADARKVLLLIFAPMRPSTGEPIQVERGWADPQALTDAAIAELDAMSGGRLVYRVAETVIDPSFPIKEDGFTYDYAAYLAALRGGDHAHHPDRADYRRIVADVDFCARVNRGDVDELWMFGGPWFGFAESALAGPGAYPYNGPGFTDVGCDRLVPIMGYNYERGLPEMIHDYGHRTEATMTKVFGGWQENRRDHAWDAFGMVASQSPDFGYSGCGSTHYPPNGAEAYDYANRRKAWSVCDDFAHYPMLGDPMAVRQQIDCSAWGCTQLGYLSWWFSHLPAAPGDHEGVWNDWWRYVREPAAARSCDHNRDTASCDGSAQCRWASCGGCLARTVADADACGPCGSQRELPACNATDGCAWYSCGEGQLSCWHRGTDGDVACGRR